MSNKVTLHVFYKNKEHKALFEAQNFKNTLRTFLGFVASKTCIFLGIDIKIAEKCRNLEQFKNILGLNLGCTYP